METTSPSVPNAVSTVMSLPVEQRIRLAQDLWASIAADPSSVTLPAEQLEEVRRRKARADADPGSLLSEDEFWRQVDGE